MDFIPNKNFISIFFLLLLLKPIDSYGLSKSNHLPVVEPFKKAVLVNGEAKVVLNSLVRDIDGDHLVFTITSPPRNGILTLEEAAKIPWMAKRRSDIVGIPFRGYYSFVKYVPNKDFIGEDEFSFSVSDRKDQPQTGKVQLVVDSAVLLPVNRPPLVTNVVYEARVGESLSINARSLASDPDGDPLMVNFSNPNKARSTFLRLDYGKVHFNTDVFNYLPSMEGTDRFDYVVDDGHHRPVVGTIEIRNGPAYSLSGVKKYFVMGATYGFKIFFVFMLFFLSIVFLKESSVGNRFLKQSGWLDDLVSKLYFFLKSVGKKTSSFPFLWIFLMFNVAYLFYHYCRVTLSPWDFDPQYCHIYDFFKNGVVPLDHGEVFLSRFLIPFLASLIPGDDPSFGFWVINFFLMNLTILVLYRAWKALSIKTTLIFFAFFWLCFHPFGIVVLYNLMPLSVDMAQYVFYSLLLYIVIRKKYWWLLILVPLVSIQKETCLLFAMAFLPFAYFHNKLGQSNEGKIPLLMVGAAVFLGFLGKFIVSHWIIASGHPNLAFDSIHFIWFQFLVVFGRDFEYAVVWLIIQFYAFGGLLLLGLDRCRENYKNNIVFNSLTFFSFLSLFVSLFLSGTAERSSFYGYPFMMTLILLFINNLRPLLVTVIFVLSLPLLGLYAVRPFDDVFFFDMARQYDRIGLYAVYMLILWGVLNKLQLKK